VKRQIEIVGEAARHISLDFQQAHPEIPWRSITGLRNILIHEYGEIKQERVWGVVSDDLPILLEKLNRLISVYGRVLSEHSA
jgi:uncharacterized protein with HEPN domain